MPAIHITPENWDSEVLKSTVPVLVDFGAEWCGPCQRLAPVIDELADDFSGRAKVVKVDVDENQQLAQQFNVMSVPTIKVFKSGTDTRTWVGYTAKSQLAEGLEEAITD